MAGPLSRIRRSKQHQEAMPLSEVATYNSRQISSEIREQNDSLADGIPQRAHDSLISKGSLGRDLASVKSYTSFEKIENSNKTSEDNELGQGIEDIDERPSTSRTFSVEHPDWDLKSILKYSDDAFESSEAVINRPSQIPIPEQHDYAEYDYNKSVSTFIESEVKAMSKILEVKKAETERKKYRVLKSRIPVPISHNPIYEAPEIVTAQRNLSYSPLTVNSISPVKKNKVSPREKSVSLERKQPDVKAVSTAKSEKLKNIREWIKSGNMCKDTRNDDSEFDKLSVKELVLNVKKPPSTGSLGKMPQSNGLKGLSYGAERHTRFESFIQHPEWISVKTKEDGGPLDLENDSVSIIYKRPSDMLNVDCHERSNLSVQEAFELEKRNTDKNNYRVFPSNTWLKNENSNKGIQSKVSIDNYSVDSCIWVPTIMEDIDKYKCRKTLQSLHIDSDEEDWICVDLPLENVPPEPEYILPGQVEKPIDWKLPAFDRDDDSDSLGPFSESFEPPEITTFQLTTWTDSTGTVSDSKSEVETRPFRGELTPLEDIEEYHDNLEPRTLFDDVEQLKTPDEGRNSSSATSKTSKTRALRELCWGIGSLPNRSRTPSSESAPSSAASLPPPPDPSRLFNVKLIDNYLSYGKSCTSFHKKEKSNLFNAIIKLFTNLKKQ